eukprot:scaffold88068_cov22-Tisochrysis_lutea.AAC.1
MTLHLPLPTFPYLPANKHSDAVLHCLVQTLHAAIMLVKASMFTEAVPQIIAFRTLFGGIDEASKNPPDLELVQQAENVEATLRMAGGPRLELGLVQGERAEHPFLDECG